MTKHKFDDQEHPCNGHRRGGRRCHHVSLQVDAHVSSSTTAARQLDCLEICSLIVQVRHRTTSCGIPGGADGKVACDGFGLWTERSTAVTRFSARTSSMLTKVAKITVVPSSCVLVAVLQAMRLCEPDQSGFQKAGRHNTNCHHATAHACL